MPQLAFILLENGLVYEGYSVGADGFAFGELIFNTALSGYQEVMTDPSYFGQIVVFTAAHVGNVGVNSEDEESEKIWSSGFIFSECSDYPSNWRMQESLPNYLKRHRTIAIAGIDTRHLTTQIRQIGSMKACIASGISLKEAKSKLDFYSGLNGIDLAKQASTTQIYTLSSLKSESTHHVVAYDFGIKQSIIQILREEGCRVTVVPCDTPAETIVSWMPDGLFLSNGPGDPTACDYVLKNIALFFKTDVPIFGICFGYQLICIALGAQCVKMKFGHHGANHPVLDLIHQRVLITSQNHSFSIDESSLPKTLYATHRSLFDGSLQGVSHVLKSIYGFQGHPESSPGPNDARKLFQPFLQAMKTYKKQNEKPSKKLESSNFLV